MLNVRATDTLFYTKNNNNNGGTEKKKGGEKDIICRRVCYR